MIGQVLEATEAMVVVMEERATEAQIEQVVARLVEMGMDVHRSTGVTRTVLGAVGRGHPDKGLIEMLEGVHEVLRISEPYKLASRTFKPEGTIVNIGDVRIGGDEVIVMAGPCSAENEKQVCAAAAAVRRAGAKIFRGGAFKPRSSPYSFQGLGEEGLRLLRDAANAENLKLITEVMDLSQIEVIDKYPDIYQVGARNMQNFTLLRELGHVRKPVMIKRGISATIEEWLLSAEYVLSGGNNDVILCERGIRTFETATRNTFDISAIPVVKKLSHLPIIADPSHGAGRRDMVVPMARAAVAAGADGLIIEVHCDPDHALSDGAQSMFPAQFDRLMAELRIIAPAIGRSICLEPAMRLHAIDVAAEDLIVLAEADIVILAAPVKQNIALLAELDENVRQPAVVTDTGSTKRDIVAAAERLPPRFTFIGGHPLAGSAHGGLSHARPDLFVGRPWLLTPALRPDGPARPPLSG